MPFKVEDKVLCHGKLAVVKFIGETHFGTGTWVGIAFSDKPAGRSDGTMQGRRYFTCPPGHGLFVRESALKPYDKTEKAALAIQSLARGSMSRRKTRQDQAFELWTQLENHDEQDILMQNRDVSKAVDSQLKIKYGVQDPITQAKRKSTRGLLPTMSVTEEMLQREMVPESYKGPRLKFPLQRDDALALLEHYKYNPDVPLHRKYAWEILQQIEEMYDDTVTNSIVRFNIPKDDKHKETRLLLCGDTHGQLNDVLWLFYKFGPPSPTNIYLFNGDIADRGKYGVEIFLILFAFKLVHPDSVLINRGNHESTDMNEVYGFATEVRAKYGGIFYRQFTDIFHLMPLATILEGRVLVLHGGLFRKDGVTLRQIESIDRKRPCPEAPTTFEDFLMFDLLWSDPCAEYGRRRSTRGVDCMMFGPDVTDKFLTRNNLEVCIRSHQVPSTGRGFEVHHDGKCVTVFSASNYAGTSGNYGGVIVFQPDLSFEIQEYWAPTMQEIQELSRETVAVTSKVEQIASKLKTAEDKASSKALAHAAERMEEDSKKKIIRMIVEKKQDLWWYYYNADDSKGGKVTSQVWREGMSAVLGDTIPWMYVQKTLKVMEEDHGMVDYNAFLKRFRIEFMAPNGIKHTRWKTETIKKVFEAILKADLSVRETLLLIDRNSDGTVCFQEFYEFMQAFSLSGLSEPQLRALMRTVTASHSAKKKDGEADGPTRIHVAQFLARFHVRYADSSKLKSTEPWIQKALQGIGRLILTEAHNQQVPSQGLSKSEQEALRRRSSSFRAIMLLQKFQTADKSGDGYLSYSDFVSTVKMLPLQDLTKELGFALDEAKLKKLAEAVDQLGSGRINYCEFLNAFHVVDNNKSDEVADEIWEEICLTLFRHKASIKRALRHFDPDLTGSVDPDDFRAALNTLNTVLARTEAPLTDEQIEELVDLMDTDDAGEVNYEEYLESFVVVDSHDTHGVAAK